MNRFQLLTFELVTHLVPNMMSKRWRFWSWAAGFWRAGRPCRWSVWWHYWWLRSGACWWRCCWPLLTGWWCILKKSSLSFQPLIYFFKFFIQMTISFQIEYGRSMFFFHMIYQTSWNINFNKNIIKIVIFQLKIEIIFTLVFVSLIAESALQWKSCTLSQCINAWARTITTNHFFDDYFRYFLKIIFF